MTQYNTEPYDRAHRKIVNVFLVVVAVIVIALAVALWMWAVTAMT